MLIDICNWQLNQDFQYIKTFLRFYLHFDQNFVHSTILFVLRLNLNFSIVFIIFDEYRGIIDKYPLDRATRFLPRLTLVVELESYAKNDYFVNIQNSMTFLFNSLQVSRVARGSNIQSHCPNAYPKLIFAWNIYIVWGIDDQGVGISET